MSLFTTINTALSGLLAQQQGLEVTGHNVANVQTPGYHRQELVTRTAPPYPSAGSVLSTGGQFGTGVEVAQIRSMRDAYLSRQQDATNGQLGRWSMGYQALSRIETMLSPGQDLDLSSSLDRFFNAWQQLATTPEAPGIRSTVQAAGIAVATTFNSAASQLDTLTQQANADLSTRVDRLNTLSEALAELNAQISIARAEGRVPNDLLDQRGVTLSEMAQLAGVTVLASDDAAATVSIGGQILVDGSYARQLQVKTGAGQPTIVWEDTPSQTVALRSGEIAGILEVRDTVIPVYRQQLDDLASALADAVNRLHNNARNPAGTITANGQPAGDFFTGTDAATLAVHADILASADAIAAAHTANAPGDGSVADAIAGVARQPLVGVQTAGQVARALVGQVGTAVQAAKTQLDTTTALRDHLHEQDTALSGVSLDEELTSLMMYQRAYEASARIMSVTDRMLETLLTQLG